MGNDDLEAALRRSEQHLAAAQRITHCGSWELDLANLDDINRNPLRWTDEVFRIFGYEPGEIEVTNESFFRAVHPDDREKISAAVAAAIANGTMYAIDHRIIRPDGSERIVHEESEIQLVDGKPVRMIGTVQDVTEQRRAEAQLAFADRMIAVGTLAAGVAHEINNPLVAVLSSLELLQRKDHHTPAEDLVQTALEGADRIRTIVRDLMVYSRAESSRTQPVDIRRVLDSALRMAGHDLRDRARIVVKYADTPAVEANESRLAQVFLNLLRNAAHAVAQRPAGDHEIRVATHRAGDVVVVEIGDTGCGISPEIRSRIFTPFLTTKPVGEGTGLGLSICHRIVSDLGGTITFDSEVDRGTTFRVTVPVSTAELPAKVTSHRTTAGYRLLVIDDEELITTALSRVFADYDVTVASSGKAALARIAAGERYDAILCDLAMPGLSGRDVYVELERRAPEQARRLIMMTGGVPSPQLRAFFQAVPWLQKPFDPDEVRKIIAATLGEQT